MDSVITPEPHLIPGYTGHCPQIRYRIGKTYGKLSHKLFIDPCTKHAAELILTAATAPPPAAYPTEKEINALKDRVHFTDTIYQHPIIPGYSGFIPNMASNTGKRFLAAATAGVANHDALVDSLRCERRLLERHNFSEGGGEILDGMTSGTLYRSPLVAVRKRAQAMKLDKCGDDISKEPYSKYTVPHFMDNKNPEKYIVHGYAGHIPMTMTRFGQSNKQLTNSALCEFANNYHHRKSEEWCPIETCGVASSTPKMSQEQFVIYHRTIGMVPSYGGHVPGQVFSIGRTYGNSTIDAKNWLASHKD